MGDVGETASTVISLCSVARAIADLPFGAVAPILPSFILSPPFGAFASFIDGVARTGLSFKLDNPLPSAGISFGCAGSFMFEYD